jgi:hypothetical protein
MTIIIYSTMSRECQNLSVNEKTYLHKFTTPRPIYFFFPFFPFFFFFFFFFFK